MLNKILDWLMRCTVIGYCEAHQGYFWTWAPGCWLCAQCLEKLKKALKS